MPNTMLARARRALTRLHVQTLRRTRPADTAFGRGRGLPIDRYYGEEFMRQQSDAIRGAVLEVGDDRYSSCLGDGRVTSIDVLHAEDGNPLATRVGDLASGVGLPSEAAYDCLILYDTLQYIFDIRAAVATSHRLLRPGGSVLATFNGIAQISAYDHERWGEFWRPTDLAVRRLFSETFGDDAFRLEVHGNVLAATGLLYGLSAEDLGPRRLDVRDPLYQVCIAVRATRQD
jgi:hypothetical protein